MDRCLFVAPLLTSHCCCGQPRIVAADKVLSLLLYYLAASAVGEITGFGLRSLLTVGGISSKKETSFKVVVLNASIPHS